MNEHGDSYADYMALAAWCAEMADAFRSPQAAMWHDAAGRRRFIREEQNAAAGWAAAAEALRRKKVQP